MRTAATAALFSFSTVAIGASGKLLDQNRKPVADAWVVAKREECNGFAHCNTFCVEVKVAKTDARGNYTFSPWFRSLDAYSLTAYRDGYLPKYLNFEPFMEHGARDSRFNSMDEVSGRIAYLAKSASEMDCFSAPQEQRLALIPVYKAMFREAVSIARFPEQHKVAREICREMYWTHLSHSDSSLSPDAERREQEHYLQGIEPMCNAPIDDSKEQEILSAIAKGDHTPVHSAAQGEFDFNRLLDGRNLPIITAAMNGSAEMVADLVAGGAKADGVGEDGRTALDHMFSDYRGPPVHHIAVVRKLLEAGANPNRPDIWGYPPLIKISSINPANVEMFELLLKHGARIDQTISCQDCSDRGRTVLHVVTDPTLARMAIERGANVNSKTPSGYTPLMYSNILSVIKILLEHGADPNIADSSGWTPLMHAIQNYEAFREIERRQRFREISETLVVAGARLDARNEHGVDAFYYTKDAELKEHLHALATKQ